MAGACSPMAAQSPWEEGGAAECVDIIELAMTGHQDCLAESPRAPLRTETNDESEDRAFWEDVGAAEEEAPRALRIKRRRGRPSRVSPTPLLAPATRRKTESRATVAGRTERQTPKQKLLALQELVRAKADKLAKASEEAARAEVKVMNIWSICDLGEDVLAAKRQCERSYAKRLRKQSQMVQRAAEQELNKAHAEAAALRRKRALTAARSRKFREREKSERPEKRLAKQNARQARRAKMKRAMRDERLEADSGAAAT